MVEALWLSLFLEKPTQDPSDVEPGLAVLGTVYAWHSGELSMTLIGLDLVLCCRLPGFDGIVRNGM